MNNKKKCIEFYKIVTILLQTGIWFYIMLNYNGYFIENVIFNLRLRDTQQDNHVVVMKKSKSK